MSLECIMIALNYVSGLQTNSAYKFAESDRGSNTTKFSALFSQLQQTSTVKYFTNTSLKMLIKLVILAALFMPSIMAALSQEEMADALIS